MNHLQKQTIEDAELVLNGKDHNYLGPDLILRRCRIILRTTARGLTTSKVKFFDCQFEAKKKLINFDMWCGTQLQNCSFTGHYAGNSFGHWDANYPNGSIKDCDFSGAILDASRFMDCDIETIQLPTWPCFTVLHPRRNRAELESISWPEPLDIWLESLLASPKQTVALADYAPEVVKGLSTSEEELRKSLEQLSCVLM